METTQQHEFISELNQVEFPFSLKFSPCPIAAFSSCQSSPDESQPESSLSQFPTSIWENSSNEQDVEPELDLSVDSFAIEPVHYEQWADSFPSSSLSHTEEFLSAYRARKLQKATQELRKKVFNEERMDESFLCESGEGESQINSFLQPQDTSLLCPKKKLFNGSIKILHPISEVSDWTSAQKRRGPEGQRKEKYKGTWEKCENKDKQREDFEKDSSLEVESSKKIEEKKQRDLEGIQMSLCALDYIVKERARVSENILRERSVPEFCSEYPSLENEYTQKNHIFLLQEDSYSRTELKLCSQKKSRKVSIFNPEKRRQKLLKFWEKQRNKKWNKKIKYYSRKQMAETRLRVKGRFVTQEQALNIIGANASDLAQSKLMQRFASLHNSCSIQTPSLTIKVNNVQSLLPMDPNLHTMPSRGKDFSTISTRKLKEEKCSRIQVKLLDQGKLEIKPEDVPAPDLCFFAPASTENSERYNRILVGILPIIKHPLFKLI